MLLLHLELLTGMHPYPIYGWKDAVVFPLNSSTAFVEFQAGLKERRAAPPRPVRATVIGSYGLDIE